MATLVDINLVNWLAAPPAITGQVIRPASDIDVNLYNWPAELDNYQCVLTLDPDNWDSLVRSNYFSQDEEDYYGMGNIATLPTILSVRFWFLLAGGADFSYGRGLLTTHGESYYSNYLRLLPLRSSVLSWYTLDWVTNPYTGIAWTLAEINALIAGVGLRRSAGGTVACVYFFVELHVTPPILPTVTTDPATLIGTTSATPNGTLDDDGGEACDCGFQWGLTAAYGNTTPTQSRTTGQTFSQVITGLPPNTVHHFRAFATNSVGTSYGIDRTFTTDPLPPAITIPTATTNPATAINRVSATLNGIPTDDGGEACDCGFEWGETIAYGNITPTDSRVTGEDFSQVIAGLLLCVTYYFRAFATNSAGTGYGAGMTFTTQCASGGVPQILGLL